MSTALSSCDPSQAEDNVGRTFSLAHSSASTQSRLNTLNDIMHRQVSICETDDISTLCLEGPSYADEVACMSADTSNIGHPATHQPGSLTMQRSCETPWYLDDEDPFLRTVDKITNTNEEHQNVLCPYSTGFGDKDIYSPCPAPRPFVTKRGSQQRTKQSHCLPSNHHQEQRLFHESQSPPSPYDISVSVGAEAEKMGKWHGSFEDFDVGCHSSGIQPDFQTKELPQQLDSGPSTAMITSAIKAVSTMGFPVTLPIQNGVHRRGVVKPMVNTDQAAEYLAGMHMDEHPQANNVSVDEGQQPQELHQYFDEDMAIPSDWVRDPRYSSDSSQQSQISRGIWENQIDVLYSGLQAEGWWSPQESDSQFFTGDSLLGAYAQPVQAQPQRASYSAFGLEDSLIPQRYGNQYPSGSEIGCAVTTVVQPACPAPSVAHTFTGDDLYMLASYPRQPPPVPIRNKSPFATPSRRRQRSSYVRSTSPSSPTLDPINARSPSRRDLRSRKSIQRLGPRRDVSSSIDTPRHRSTSRPPRTPKTPKLPSGVSLQRMDFVNFTPKDANKLLSDVAPSGSSKTRARREQEAREKSKKLNEAALLAVKKNGGDVEAFRKELLRKGEIQIT